MANQSNGNQFRDDEIVVLTENRDGKLVKRIHPKIGGRLRLAHEGNEQVSISTEIIEYDENLAVVRATASTMKGSFPGYGMASRDRDRTIAPAILELAETRAIARSLRFAGYGVEYCSAEEISHLENANGNRNTRQAGEKPSKPPKEEPKVNDGEKPGNGGNGGDRAGGNGDARISNKQLNYIVNLGRNLNLNSKDLDHESVKAYGVKMALEFMPASDQGRKGRTLPPVIP
jgi:hypothetical protein